MHSKHALGWNNHFWLIDIFAYAKKGKTDGKNKKNFIFQTNNQKFEILTVNNFSTRLYIFICQYKNLNEAVFSYVKGQQRQRWLNALAEW